MIYKCVRKLSNTYESFPVYIQAENEQAAMRKAEALSFVFKPVPKEGWELRVSEEMALREKCADASAGI